MNVYIILLESTESNKVQNKNKYYITSSDITTATDIFKIFNKPKEPSLAWTKKYKAVDIVEVIKTLHEKYEYYIMIHYMQLYGVDNVRSSIYPELSLSEEIIKHLQCDIGKFCFIDKYQSYNYVPLFSYSVGKHLHTFFNSTKYTSSINKDYTIQEEINRLHTVLKNIKELHTVISSTNGLYYGPYNNRIFIDFVSLMKNNELMKKIYYHDDKYIAKGCKSDVDDNYNDILQGIHKLSVKFNLLKYSRKCSILLLNLVEFNLQKKKELTNIILEEVNVNCNASDFLEYIILGLTEEKFKFLDQGIDYDRITTYDPPPYENNCEEGIKV